MEVRQLGNCMENGNRKNPNQGRVYDQNGLCPTLTDMQGGGRQPMVIDNIPCKLDKMPEGHLTSINNAKICDVGTETASTITARYYKGIGAHKDNMVMETVRMDEGRENEERDTVKALQILRKEIGEENFFKWSVGGLRCILQEAILRQNVYAKRIYEDWKNRSELFQCTYNSKRNKSVDATEEDLRNMWEEWSIRCSSYGRGLSEQRAKQLDDFVQKLPHETTSQKRFVYCVWKASEGIQLLRETLSEVQKIWESDDNEQGTRTHYRIRKLTPKSCWRLMDFSDEDFHKAEKVNSNTQLYKQAGNSIVKNVLVAIFGQMLPGKEDVYRGISNE